VLGRLWRDGTFRPNEAPFAHLRGGLGVWKDGHRADGFSARRFRSRPVRYRSDKFTPKAFVTHAANIKKDELAQIDLLPKLNGKVLLTKELAPLFRGREEDLKDNFSILISVLDGKGFTSDSGTHGRRGYSEPVLFNWIGATTPLPPSTHRLMSQLGTRLCFTSFPRLLH